jgi:hypothetical protein
VPHPLSLPLILAVNNNFGISLLWNSLQLFAMLHSCPYLILASFHLFNLHIQLSADQTAPFVTPREKPERREISNQHFQKKKYDFENEHSLSRCRDIG